MYLCSQKLYGYLMFSVGNSGVYIVHISYWGGGLESNVGFTKLYNEKNCGGKKKLDGENY